MKVCGPPGTVSETLAAAAVAKAEDTPGTTSQSMPSASSRAACSRTAPKSAGSPVCTRAARPPESAQSRSRVWVSGSDSGAESTSGTPGRALASTSGGTSDPA